MEDVYIQMHQRQISELSLNMHMDRAKSLLKNIWPEEKTLLEIFNKCQLW